MNQFILSVLFFTMPFSGSAQADNKIVLGKIDNLHSTVLNEDRKIWVYVPNSRPDDIPSTQHYPVVYLLDGDAHFFSVVGMIQQLTSVNGNTICPEMIVVGIPNTDRTRDLTPTHVNSDPPFMDSNSSKNSGGGEKFIAFIEKELMPYIDSSYPTAPYRLLIGHSFGGLTAINTLAHHSSLFNAYVVIDPSMWWDHKKLLGETRQILNSKKFAGISVFLGIANTMNAGMDTIAALKDTSTDTRHIRSILELSKYLADNKGNGLNFQYKYYSNDDHGSVPLIAEYDALHFLFSYYPLKLSRQDYMEVNKRVVTKIEKHYEMVSQHFGFITKPPESMINDFGYQALNAKHFEDAEYIFKLNVANYPKSFSAYDSMGDLCVAKGDKTGAIDNFRKSLSIRERPDTRKKLEKLQGDR